MKRNRNIDVTDIPGGGAAGGVGAVMAAFLDADLRFGAEIVAKVVGLEELTRASGLGELPEKAGSTNRLCAEILLGVVSIAARFDTPVVAFCGSLGAGFKLSYS